MSVRINIDHNAVITRIQAANKKALAEMAEQALSNCNEFCPEDQGVLKASSATHSKFAEGKLVWSTPYARFLYYGVVMVDSQTGSPWARHGDRKRLTGKPLKYHKKHNSSTPCKLWCEKAREIYGSDWRLIYENALKEAMK